MSFWSMYASTLNTHVHACITLDAVSTTTNLFTIYQCHILQYCFSLADTLFGILHSMGILCWVHTDYSMLKDIAKYFPLIHFHYIVFLKIHPFLPGLVIKPLVCIVIFSCLDTFALQLFFSMQSINSVVAKMIFLSCPFNLAIFSFRNSPGSCLCCAANSNLFFFLNLLPFQTPCLPLSSLFNNIPFIFFFQYSHQISILVVTCQAKLVSLSICPYSDLLRWTHLFQKVNLKLKTNRHSGKAKQSYGINSKTRS